eukprot:CAMPEP_0117605616 /NCGR_PEP_ID=MMETSP0784-20121206/79286_1 /TAXON_ID=39447 /ORGANISM="" /LENGTH=173 /DNA_ID=CAMNT_0005408667 /DNA_START=170 /DNA_END=689 /DNA_ORIENTATION=+
MILRSSSSESSAALTGSVVDQCNETFSGKQMNTGFSLKTSWPRYMTCQANIAAGKRLMQRFAADVWNHPRVVPRSGWRAQLPLCPIVEPDAPIKKIAHDDPRWSAFHSGADTFDAPLRALKWSLLRRAPQNAGLVATPVPRLRLPQQVARRFDASMHQTESNDAFCVGIRGYE